MKTKEELLGGHPIGRIALVAAVIMGVAAFTMVGDRRPFRIVQEHVSLTVGRPYRLTLIPADAKVVWSSDNPRVRVDPNGTLLAGEDAMGEDARAMIVARLPQGRARDTCEATIVNWQANVSQLEVVATPRADQILAADGEAVYFTCGRALHVTSDGFETSRFLCTLPGRTATPPLLTTPFGHFLRCGATIYRSQDLTTWTTNLVMNAEGMVHGLAFDYDADSQTGYLYAAEYSVDPNRRHALYHGIFTARNEPRWSKVMEFASPSEWEADPTVPDAARHIHTVAVDPYTGHVWLGTGDANVHCRIMYSDDRGQRFRLIGMGSQIWRTLSIWFTERHVYWSVDTSAPQSIWRVPRSRFEEAGCWPSMTPELESGTTKTGLGYLVTRNGTPGRFPTTAGHVYTETQVRPLDARNRVRPLDDPRTHYREEVAQLFNGAFWYHTWAKDDAGEPLVLLAQSAEGALRDYRGRVFGIKEYKDGAVAVHELLSVSSSRPDVYDRYTKYAQFVPVGQDARGYVYFAGRQTAHRTYKTRLRWRDGIDCPIVREPSSPVAH